MRDSVPPEFLGRAKLFRNKVIEADLDWAQMRDQVWNGLEQRVRRKIAAGKRVTFRKPDAVTSFRAWANHRVFGRLPDAADMDFTPQRIEFRDMSLSATEIEHSERPGMVEEAVACSAIRLIAEADHLDAATGQRIALIDQPIVHILHIGLHALGRFYQRAFGQHDDDALCRSLWSCLPYAFQALETEAREFAVPALAHEGHWFGHITIMRANNDSQFVGDYRTLAIRTFHAGLDHGELWTSQRRHARPSHQEA